MPLNPINQRTQAESLLHSLERVSGGIGLHEDTDSTSAYYHHKKGVVFLWRFYMYEISEMKCRDFVKVLSLLFSGGVLVV